MTDMAHFAGLVAAGLHPSPVPHSALRHLDDAQDARRPRAGFVLCREEHAQALDRAIFPGMQGGPLMHTIAAKATCFRIAADRGLPRLPAAGAPERRHARGGFARRRLRRAHRRHRHPPCPARLARDRVDRPCGARTPPRVQADREPQHGALRQRPPMVASRRPDRHAGSDDARLRRSTTSPRSPRSSSARSRTAPRSRRSPPEPWRSATAAPSTRLPRLHDLRRVSGTAAGSGGPRRPTARIDLGCRRGEIAAERGAAPRRDADRPGRRTPLVLSQRSAPGARSREGHGR